MLLTRINLFLFAALFAIISCTGGINRVRSDADKGCYYNERVMQDSTVINAYFDFDSHKLKEAQKLKIANALGALNMLPNEVSVSLLGYTDSIGKRSYNNVLSDKRVNAVKKYLDQLGYSKISTDLVEGVGKSSLQTKCSDLSRKEKIKCLSELRRVEIIILVPKNRPN